MRCWPALAAATGALYLIGRGARGAWSPRASAVPRRRLLRVVGTSRGRRAAAQVRRAFALVRAFGFNYEDAGAACEPGLWAVCAEAPRYLLTPLAAASCTARAAPRPRRRRRRRCARSAALRAPARAPRGGAARRARTYAGRAARTARATARQQTMLVDERVGARGEYLVGSSVLAFGHLDRGAPRGRATTRSPKAGAARAPRGADLATGRRRGRRRAAARRRLGAHGGRGARVAQVRVGAATRPTATTAARRAARQTARRRARLARAIAASSRSARLRRSYEGDLTHYPLTFTAPAATGSYHRAACYALVAGGADGDRGARASTSRAAAARKRRRALGARATRSGGRSRA